MLITVATLELRNAGHDVQPAEGVPGLWNVQGLAYDITSGQLLDLARQHGSPYPMPIHQWDVAYGRSVR